LRFQFVTCAQGPLTRALRDAACTIRGGLAVASRCGSVWSALHAGSGSQRLRSLARAL